MRIGVRVRPFVVGPAVREILQQGKAFAASLCQQERVRGSVETSGIGHLREGGMLEERERPRVAGWLQEVVV